MAQSTIEWTESTWNPVTGCDDASPGCENCYARRMARRLEAMGAYNYRNGFQADLAAANAGSATEMAKASAGLREFHERPVSRRGAEGLHSQSI